MKHSIQIIALLVSLTAITAEAQGFSKAEKECLAKTISIEAGKRNLSKLEYRALAEMYINQSRSNGYPDTLCAIYQSRASKSWNKTYTDKVNKNWGASYKTQKFVANEVATFAGLNLMQPITAGALEYNYDGKVPKPNMWKTIRTGTLNFYTTHSW